jgi:hypothetical protein
MPQFTENYKNKNRRSSNLELLRLKYIGFFIYLPQNASQRCHFQYVVLQNIHP